MLKFVKQKNVIIKEPTEPEYLLPRPTKRKRKEEKLGGSAPYRQPFEGSEISRTRRRQFLSPQNAKFIENLIRSR